jgi:Spy/CpxP family protein refolding chaperone
MRSRPIRKLFGILLLAALGVVPAVAFAQTTPQPPAQGGDRPPVSGRAGRRADRLAQRPGRQERHGFGRLNLTDAQREQLRAVESRYAQGFRTRREELRGIAQTRRQGGTLTEAQQSRLRQLRDEMRADAARMREEMRNLLTEEQRQQLRTTRDEMRRRRDEVREQRQNFRQRRMERRRGRADAPPPPPA